ncbi:MAG: aldo/keto reductase [Pseudomonadales bacterium]|nr:aldo/keto reductase [Pseudomonadales bacterium]MCP5183327.1 aldo/keto reductase [Pseudomonadales bacterium]
MATRPLGNTGLVVSRLALGTVKIGRNAGLRYPAPAELPDDNAVRTLLDTAAELGINLLDTAPAYGSSEERLGGLLTRYGERFLLCTKTGEAFEHGSSRHDFSARHTRMSVERSLRRLRTKRLAIVLIHSNGDDENILRHTDIVATLRDLKTRGDVAAIGLSAKSAAGIRAAVAANLDVVMATLNPAYTAERDAMREAHAAGLGVLVKKAMASGGAGMEALAFVSGEPAVDCIVSGTANPGHLRANALAVMAGRAAGAACDGT